MEVELAQILVKRIRKHPTKLFTNDIENKEQIYEILQSMFQNQLKKVKGKLRKGENVPKIAFKGFGVEQVWAQIVYHTDSINQHLINNLTSLISNQQFLDEIDQLDIENDEHQEDEPTEEELQEDEEKEAEGIDGDYGDEDKLDEDEEDEELDRKQRKHKDDEDDDDLELDEYGKEFEDESELDEFLEDQEEEAELKDQLKIPSDLEGDDDDEEEGIDEDEQFDQFNDGNEEQDDNENDVFNLAKENDELGNHQLNSVKPEEFANKDMIDKIDKIENQMVGGKNWQMLGEVHSRERPLNSLLEHHLDFNTASKLPPTITQEKSSHIETMIKQRILDELFDDPVRKFLPSGKKNGLDDDMFDFTKSKKGLGEQYEDDYKQKLLKSDPSAFVSASLTGADSALKQEITGLMKTLFYQLDQLSNFHFTPKPPSKEAQISTSNVASIMIEDAIPISVSKGQSKSAREVFSINNQMLREKTELSKEERRKERATRKRKIKSHLKYKELNKKEEKRNMGVAMNDRFEMKQIKKKVDKNAEKGPAKGDMKSSKFFKKMQEVASQDQIKKDNKKKAKLENKGKNVIVNAHTNQSTKRFKL